MPQNYPTPSVVRARRIVGLLVLGGLIWGVIAGVSAVYNFVTGLFNPNQTNTLVAGADCQPQLLSIEAHVGTADAVNQGAFNPGDTPYFWFTITNTGPVDCTFNVGTSATFYSVTSGSDNVWSSKDCKGVTRTDYVINLMPNKPMSNPPTDWQRVRSSGSGCSIPDGQPTVPAGGASYVLRAEVNGVISENTTQFVLN
jgi:hypothetical protein